QLDEFPSVDLTIDGADEVDSRLNAIKGGGAAHLQEKVVASASKRLVLVADYRKDSSVLGEQWTKGVPVEV
ncbi:ribose-5-phosphate isomerase rki1, partial [Spiromyces aspiralis]